MKPSLLALALFATPAWAHSDGAMHYPTECCHNLDCAPAEKVETMSTQKFITAGMGFSLNLKLPTQTVITIKVGNETLTAVVPENLARRESTDGRVHACIRKPTGANAYMNCVFFPPGL